MTVHLTPHPIQKSGLNRVGRLSALGLAATLMLSACSGSKFDWDMRSGNKGPSTSSAANSAGQNRPAADARGVISYPGYQVVVAQRGDTVAAVASRLGIGADQLASYNALKPTDSLRDGEILALPNRVATFDTMGGTSGNTGQIIGGPNSGGPIDVTTIATTALDRVGPSPTSKTTGATGGAEPVRHKVARGETAFTIARSYNVSAKSLADWNGLGPDLTVREGQYLIIPVAGATAPATIDSSAPGQPSNPPEPPSSKKPLPTEKTTAASSKTNVPKSPDLGAQRSSATASRFVMPTDGKIIRGYVKKKNDGIDISAPAGSAVKAASDGTVAAVTKDTEGTPIIVLRHADGILTVYAGVDGVKVAKGAAVKRGQTIALVRAGAAPFVHFEVRKGVESVDPMPYVQ